MSSSMKTIHYKIIFIIVFLVQIILQFSTEKVGVLKYNEIFSSILLFGFLFAIFLFIIAQKQDIFLGDNGQVKNLYIGILVTCCLIYISRLIPIYHLWMIGCFWLAVSYTIYLGTFSIAIFICLDGMSKGYTVEDFIFYGIIGVLLCILVAFYPSEEERKNWIMPYIYYVLIAICSHVALYLVTNHLEFRQIQSLEGGITLLITIINVTFIYMLLYYFKYKSTQNGDVIIIENETLLRPDFELLVKLKEDKPLIYKHSLVVARIARGAAECIGADQQMVYLGGLYHEVGKLVSDENYSEHNVVFAHEYNFSNRLIDVISSHDMKLSYPESKEAAILFLTDHLISTIYYMVQIKQVQNVTREMIISHYFEKRSSDDRLDQSGLTLKDFRRLKEYYINYFNREIGAK